jgi:hypothetical protein
MDRILLVYDPATAYSEAFSQRLNEQGIEVCYAGNEEICLRALRRLAPNFLLLAPVDDSLDINRFRTALKTRKPWLGSCCLLITGQGSDRELARRWALPLELCFTQPLDEARFLRQLGAPIPRARD